jgi:tRNA (guanosine-2'-O-)-methyltransferase
MTNETLIIDDEEFTLDQIQGCFDDLLTSERKDKIHRVVNGRTRKFTIILEKLYDQGNISAIMRTAENFGLLDIHIIESTQTKYSSRTTQGAHKWLNRKIWQQTPECLKKLKAEGYQIVATALSHRAVPLTEINLDRPTAFVVGNEKDGVSKEAIEMADANCLIPTTGFSQSFNVSIAAALIMGHVALKYDKDWCDLDDDQKRKLTLDYYLRTYKSHHKLLERLKNEQTR